MPRRSRQVRVFLTRDDWINFLETIGALPGSAGDWTLVHGSSNDGNRASRILATAPAAGKSLIGAEAASLLEQDRVVLRPL